MKNKKFLCLLMALAMTASVSPCVYASEVEGEIETQTEGQAVTEEGVEALAETEGIVEPEGTVEHLGVVKSDWIIGIDDGIIRVPLGGNINNNIRLSIYTSVKMASGEERPGGMGSGSPDHPIFQELDTTKAGLQELHLEEDEYFKRKISWSAKVLVFDYPDAQNGEWFYPYVVDMSEKNVMTGYDNGMFGTYDNLTRGQFATVLYRITPSNTRREVNYTGAFPDVEDGQFYTVPAEWAKAEDVITGYENGNFGPVDEITREQLVTIMYRYVQANSPKEEGQHGGVLSSGPNMIPKHIDASAKADYTGFPDAAYVSDFASEAMQWAIANEIIKGNGDGTLAPQGKVSRAVCATIISRYMGE